MLSCPNVYQLVT